ncbi:MAG: DUF1295 domain-containing protein [Chitinophagales bacterium]|nr:DUF1295 domain-containing protein [Chitinophagales bacterium]
MITTDVTWFNYLVIGWIILAILLLPLLIFVRAPYGRHSNEKWGPMIDNKLGWILMESPSLFMFAILFLIGPVEKTTTSWIFFACWTFHYTNRSFIFPLRTKTNGKKMPLMISLSAVLFNLVNGGINGYFLGFLGPEYSVAWMQTPQFIIGISLFIIGMVINWQSDNILLNLRKPGEGGYKIPQGGLFKYVTSPNFFGEIIEWTGFAIMVWSLPALSFAIWTFCNLVPRGLNHHAWYKEKFGSDYPSDRKAILPGLV